MSTLLPVLASGDGAPEAPPVLGEGFLFLSHGGTVRLTSSMVEVFEALRGCGLTTAIRARRAFTPIGEAARFDVLAGPFVAVAGVTADELAGTLRFLLDVLPPACGSVAVGTGFEDERPAHGEREAGRFFELFGGGIEETRARLLRISERGRTRGLARLALTEAMGVYHDLDAQPIEGTCSDLLRLDAEMALLVQQVAHVDARAPRGQGMAADLAHVEAQQIGARAEALRLKLLTALGTYRAAAATMRACAGIVDTLDETEVTA